MSKTAKTRNYGEGSVYQRKDGRWVAKYKSEEMVKPYVMYGKTETEAKRKLRDFKKETARGLTVCRKILFRDYVSRWLYSFKQSSVASSSFDRYESVYLKHIKPVFGDRQLASIRGMDIQDFLIEQSEKYSLSLVKVMRVILAELFEFAHSEGDILRNPMRNVKLPKRDSFKPQRIVTTMEDSEVLLLEQAAKQQKENGQYLIPYAGLIVFLVHTGLRCGELLALKWSDIDFEEKTVTVNKNLTRVIDRNHDDDIVKRKNQVKSTKTVSGNRVVPLNKKAISALKLLKKNYAALHIESEFVAISRQGKLLSNVHIRRVLLRMIKAVGIEHTYSVHQLRHTFATRSLKSGVPIAVVSKWLGHAGITMTLNTYIHASKADESHSKQLLNAM